MNTTEYKVQAVLHQQHMKHMCTTAAAYEVHMYYIRKIHITGVLHHHVWKHTCAHAQACMSNSINRVYET